MLINPAKSYTLFSSSFRLGKASPKKWYPMNCPFCDHSRNKEKFALHFSYNIGKCWECDYKANFVQLAMDVFDLDYPKAKELLQSQEESYVDFEILQTTRSIESTHVTLPVGFVSILDGETVLGMRAREYLSKRGFNLNHLDMMGVGYCIEKAEKQEDNYFGYIIIPFKYQGMLRYYIGRDFLEREKKYKYKNPSVDKFGVGKADLFFNEDALDLYDDVFLLEGYFDAVCTGRNAMASLGWSLSDTQIRKILKSSAERFTFLPDKGFYHLAVKTAMNFLDEKEVVVVNLDNVLPDQPLKKDVNELGIENVTIEIEKTPVLTYSNAVKILMN